MSAVSCDWSDWSGITDITLLLPGVRMAQGPQLAMWGMTIGGLFPIYEVAWLFLCRFWNICRINSSLQQLNSTNHPKSGIMHNFTPKYCDIYQVLGCMSVVSCDWSDWSGITDITLLLPGVRMAQGPPLAILGARDRNLFPMYEIHGCFVIDFEIIQGFYDLCRKNCKKYSHWDIFCFCYWYIEIYQGFQERKTACTCFFPVSHYTTMAFHICVYNKRVSEMRAYLAAHRKPGGGGGGGGGPEQAAKCAICFWT